MGDAPPVTVPTAVRDPFDFGDEPFGDHDAIASVLDDAGRILGVERDAGRASKAAPAVFDRASRSEYAAPSAAAAAAAKAVADELEALADGFPAEESLGVQIGTIGGSRAAAAATAALATDAKAARRADQLKKYGRGGSPEPGTGAAKKNVRLPRSIYARDLESHARAKAEREAREARARAPFVTARYGVKLPAPVASVQIGEKSAKARARRAALLAANQAKQMRLRPESAGPLRSVPGNAPGPWRVNANVAHDVTDPVSVAFNDAKRARAKAALRAKEEREKRDPAGLRAPRVDRSKYPSFKAWLDAQAAHDARLRAQMPGYADAARAANAKRREAAYVAKARAASGVPNAPGERKMIPDVAGDVKKTSPASPDPAPALNRFIALTEAFADASSGADAGKMLSAEDQEKALMECAAEAAREAVEAAAAAASRASIAADRRDEDDAAAAAALVGEAAYEDEALLRQVAEVRTPTKASTEPFILGQNPRGSPRALFGASAFGSASAEAMKAEPDPKMVAGDDAAEKTREERLADALSAMTPEERLAARAKASKGWSGDFTGVFYASKTAEGEDASASAAPTWSEKPKSPNARGGSSRDEGSANDADDDDDDAKVDTDALAVQFIGPNAAELAFRALNPDAPKEATFDGDGSKRKEAYASPGATAAAAAAARAAEGLDPSDPASVVQCKARLAEMGIEFFGKQADAMAFQAVFPEHDVPKDPDAKDAETPAETRDSRSGKDAFDPAVPLAHQTGAAGLAVEFIGANAEELTRRALGGDDANEDDAGLEAHAVWSSDREAEALASALPSTPDAKPSPVEKRETETPLETAETAETAEALSAAQEEAWAKAEVAVPGTSAAPATLEANLEDARTAAGDVAAAEAAAAATAAQRDDRDDDEEAFSAQTDAAFAEAERASAIDAGSGAAVPTALVAPLAEDALRDAGAPGGGEL